MPDFSKDRRRAHAGGEAVEPGLRPAARLGRPERRAIKDAGGGIAMTRFLRRLMDRYDKGPPAVDRSAGLAPLERPRHRRRPG
jgi:hypothetical protein